MLLPLIQNLSVLPLCQKRMVLPVIQSLMIPNDLSVVQYHEKIPILKLITLPLVSVDACQELRLVPRMVYL